MKQSQKVEDYFSEIRKIEEDYYDLLSNLNLNFPKPLNLKQEKKKFFSAIADDKVYNPKIKYEKKIFNEEILEKIKNFKIDKKNDIYGFKKLYSEKFKNKLDEIYCHKYWGTQESTKYAIAYRGNPSYLLLKKAKKFCDNYKRQKIKFRRITPKVVGDELKKYVYELTKNKIKVTYIELYSKVNITAHANLINVNPNISFRSLDLKRLKVHEIGVHYMRYYNGNQFGLKILESGTSNYIITEEGLAAYFEELMGVSSSAQLYIYAGRVIATYYCLTLGFYEIFKILKSYGFKDEDAFAITYRTKRNLSDTSKPGGFTKDYVYFKGYYKIKKYAKKNDIRDLFIGKIKIEDIKILKKFISENRNKIKMINLNNKDLN